MRTRTMNLERDQSERLTLDIFKRGGDKRRVVSNLGWILIDKFVRLGLGLLVGIWVARYLGPTQFGVWSYVTALVALFSAVASSGLPTILIRDLVRDPSHVNEILGSAFVLQFLGGICAIALCVGAATLTDQGDNLARVMVAVVSTAFLFQSLDVIDSLFQSRVQSKYTVAAKGFAFCLASGVRVLLIMARAPLISFALAALLESFIGASMLLVVYRHQQMHITLWRPSAAKVKKLAGESWPLIISGLFVMLYMRIDQVMLRTMMGNGAVGSYSAAVRIAEVWYFIPVAVTTSVVPGLLKEKDDRARYLDRMQTLFDGLAWSAIGISVVVSLFSGTIINLIYGAEYADASKALVILGWASVFVSLGVASGQFLISEGLGRISLLRAGSGAVTNICLNFWLIPAMGILGAAIATLISYGVSVFSVGLIPGSRVSLSLLANTFNLPRLARKIQSAL